MNIMTERFRKLLPVSGVIPLLVAGCVSMKATRESDQQWFRGNTHAHSLWSDGNGFPEMIMKWYKDNGYDFTVLSDHNVLSVGEKWIPLKKVSPSAFEKYVAAFGKDWVETREKNGPGEVKLKRLEEYREMFEQTGEFLILQAEEITSRVQGKPLHMNAVNLPGNTPIPAIRGGDKTIREAMRETLQAVARRERQTGQPILIHLNHPNFGWAITPEDLARVVEEPFFEVYNGHPGVNHMGDAKRPGDEKIWDTVNTIRLLELDASPLFGVATDDSHKYHGGNNPPGRGWIMVRAQTLDGDAIVRAMRKGAFYASSGVFIKSLEYDPEQRRLSIEIEPVEGVTFTTQWIGTRRAETVADANIGEVFEEQTGTRVSFVVPENALYARATITSSRAHPKASFKGQKEQAWLQPVGWRK